MIDFHTHTLLSDGELIPSELARRAEEKGYRALGIADHVDGSNADLVIPRLVSVCRDLREVMDIDVIPGAEITHVPPSLIASLVAHCRELGAEFVMVHGETLAEPVKAGTNDAALKAGIDILAHPGFLLPRQAREAAARGVYLELSARQGHCLANGLVARQAVAAGARLIVGSDTHSPADLLIPEEHARIARGAGLKEEEVEKASKNAERLWNAIKKRRG